MNLNCETILNFYTLKRRKFLCHIKVNSKSQTYENTCRGLSQSQWAIFDKNLENLLTASNKFDENGYFFNLNPLIEVKVQKSKSSFKYIYELFYTFGEFNRGSVYDVTDEDLVLECLIDFQKEVSFTSSIETQEYEPEAAISLNALPGSSVPYEPYTPSKKNSEDSKINLTKNNNDINYLESNEDTYSPKPLLDERVSAPHFVTSIPEYTPAPINDRRRRKENNKVNLLKHTGHEIKTLVKQKRNKYKRVECEYIPESQDVKKHSAPIYIPTPIEEITQKLYNGDKIKTFRKRSKTIDAFSELVTKIDEDTQITKTIQHIYDGNPQYLSQKSSKKRSVTIDEIPDEFYGKSTYIPSPLDEKPFHEASRTSELRKQSFSEYLPFNENRKDNNQCSDRKIPKMVENDPTVVAIPNCGIIAGGGNPTALTRCKENNMYPATSEGKSSYGDQDLINPNKKPQSWSEYTDRVFKTRAEKNLFSKKNVNNLQAKAMSSKSQSDAKNSERILETQKKESDIKREIYNRSEKYTKGKRSPDNLSTNFLVKQDSKIENHDIPELKNCRRSERSPNKPKRLIEEQLNSLNKMGSKKLKSSLKNKELFGTDDEDDDDALYKNISNNKIFSTLKRTSSSKELNTSSSSLAKKLKKDRNPEAGREAKLK